MVHAPDTRTREIWVDLRGLGSTAPALLAEIDTSRFDAFLASPAQAGGALPVQGRIAVDRTGKEGHAPSSALPDDAIAVYDAASAAQGSGPRALFRVIASEADLHGFARELDALRPDYGIVELRDETNIPLELLIAWFQETPVRILKMVSDVESADIALRTLEHGADGILLATGDADALRRAATLTQVAPSSQLDLTTWEVTSMRYLGWGHRALVDTVSLLTKEEGMLVGSTCNAFAMMCSETHDLPYMPLRPFRVNTAAVHSYLLTGGDFTRYLGDVERGMETLVVDVHGRARSVPVGRVKIERRPLLLIEFTDGETEGSIVVQADWHVRIMGADGKPINVTHCKAGTKLMGWKSGFARHCGNAISEELIER